MKLETEVRLAVESAVESTLSAKVINATAVPGGDVNQAFRLTLSSGRTVFAKLHNSAPQGMFESEAVGLSLLRQGPLRVPEVLAQERRFLLLEDLGAAAPNERHDETLARGLASLHSLRSSVAGCSEAVDGYIATLPIDNTPADWVTFYGGRLERLFQRAHLGPEWTPRIDAIQVRLRSILRDAPVALLHGDLWRGNVHTGDAGAPCLVDPSAYYGDPEVDLAMMHLFGGFSPRVFDAYDEVMPPRPGRDLRRGAYQLYPVLVHLLLFGRSYLRQLDRLMRSLE